MEHIITKEMEERLTKLLENPKHDPHRQPIPERG
jgi:manganese/zinc/iron transport system permease protein